MKEFEHPKHEKEQQIKKALQINTPYDNDIYKIQRFYKQDLHVTDYRFDNYRKNAYVIFNPINKEDTYKYIFILSISHIQIEMGTTIYQKNKTKIKNAYHYFKMENWYIHDKLENTGVLLYSSELDNIEENLLEPVIVKQVHSNPLSGIQKITI